MSHLLSKQKNLLFWSSTLLRAMANIQKVHKQNIAADLYVILNIWEILIF